MINNIELLTASLDAAPGEVLAAMVRVNNTSAVPVTHRATPIGLGDELGDVWKGQALVVPANSVLDLPVQIPVPPSFGIGHHAVAIEVETGADVPVLLPLTLAIASVERVELRATPTPLRGRRKVKFVLDVVNREPHTVELLLESETPDVDVSFEMPTMTLGPGQQSWTRGRVRGPRKLVGDRTQHNLKLVARGRAASSSIAVPYIQRPVFAYRLRSAVAVAAVLALWMGAMVLVSQRYVFNKTNDDVSAPTTSVVEPAGDDGSVPIPGAADAGTGDGSDGTADSGDSPGEASASDEPGDAGGGDGSGDAGGGDAGGGDGSGDAGDGADEAGSPDGTEGPTADTPVEVRGTIDVAGGSIDGVTITPAPMSLKNVAELDPNVTSFAATSRPEPRKIWSARGIIAPVEPVRLAQTEPIPAGDFAPDADGIWALPLAQRQAYELAFSKPGFQTQAFVITPELGNTPELAVELEPATGELGGVVTGGGRPLENVVLLVTTGTFDYQTVTDGNGRWALTGLDTSAHYTIVASLDGYGAAVRRVRLAPGEPQTNVSIALPFGQSVLQGSVTDTLGNPIPGAKVTANNGAESRSTTTLTDEASLGAYQLPQLETNATYSVTIELEGYETTTTKIQLSSLTQVENFTVKALAARVSGRVMSDSGEAIGGATVRLDVDSVMEPISSVQTAASDEEKGQFNLGLVPPGRYALTVIQWEHEPTRLQLVVTSAQQATLSDVSGVVLPEQLGLSFDIEMERKELRPAAERPKGSLAFDIIDSNPNPSTCESLVDDCRSIQNVEIEIRTTDDALKNSASFVDGVFLCPEVPCNNTTKKEFRIDEIPIGTYTVTFTNVNFNDVTETYTVLPGSVSVEDVTMIRKGELVGAFVDSTNATDSLWTSSNVFIVASTNFDVAGCKPGVVITPCSQVIETEPVQFTNLPKEFQSDSEDLLSPGTWGVQVVAPDGFFVRSDQEIVDGLDPFTFVIGDNPGVFNQVRVLIEADPYPNVSMRVFKPKADALPEVSKLPDGTAIFDDVSVLEPFQTGVSASLDCGSLVRQDAVLDDGFFKFDKVATQELDTDGNGLFGNCEITVSADDFDDAVYQLGAPQAVGTAASKVLRLGEDRFIDIALAATLADGTGELVGLLSYTEPDLTVRPIVGANIVAEDIITALIAGEHSDQPSIGSVVRVTPFTESLDSQISEAGLSAGEWNAWAAQRQILGTTTLDFTGLPGVPTPESGTVEIAVNGRGEESYVTTGPLGVSRNPSNRKLEVMQNPVEGNLLGQVEIITTDPDPAYDAVKIESKSSALGSTFEEICCGPGDGGSYDLAKSAGTWTTKITAIPSNHQRLTDAIPPTPPTVDLTPFGEVSQRVPAGGSSAPYIAKLIELGSLEVEVVDSSGNDIPGIVPQINGGTSQPFVISDVPTVLTMPPTPTTHKLTILNTDAYDITKAEVVVTELFNVASPVIGAPSTVDLTGGFDLDFLAGTKYSVEIVLPLLGSVGGTISGADGYDICQNGTDIKATVRAVSTGLPTLTLGPLETCGAFNLSGAPGDYSLEVTHPEFSSSTTTNVEIKNEETTTENPSLTILPSKIVMTVEDFPAPTAGSTDLTSVYYMLGAMTEPKPIGDGNVPVDPGTYVLEVRRCSSAPADRPAFENCVERFPVKVSGLAVGRTNSGAGQTTVNVDIPLLNVGGTINLDLSLVNAASTPENLCPSPDGTAVGTFVRTFQRSTNAQVTAEVTVGSTLPGSTVPVTTDEGTYEESDDGNCLRPVIFNELVASGLHTIKFPAVPGYNRPDLTLGTGLSMVATLSAESGGYYTAVISYAPSNWGDAATIGVKYTADRVDVLLEVCGEEPGAASPPIARCGDDFPGLAASLETPIAVAPLRTYTTSEVDPGNSRFVKISDVDPSLIGYLVNVTDDLHVAQATGLLPVNPGTQIRQTVTVPGAKILVEVHPLRQDLPGVLTPIGANDSSDIKIELFGRNSGASWILLTTTWDECPRANETGLRLCFNVDALYDELKVVVSDDTDASYRDGVATVMNAALGESVLLEPTTDKRALLRVLATMDDGTDVPTELAEKVQLRVDGGSAAAGDLVPRAGCQSSSVPACFEFYADPGSSYIGFILASSSNDASVPSYLEDISSNSVAATIGMVPTNQGSDLNVEFVVNQPPGKPQVPTLGRTAGEDGQVDVSWMAGTAGGTATTGYTVTVTGGPSNATSCPSTTALSCTKTGLTPGVEYTFTVAARNVAGSSSTSDSASIRPGGPPDAPTVTATPGLRRVTLEWTTPNNHALPITGYTVTATGGPSNATSCPVPDPLTDPVSCDVTGLTEGDDYTFTVAAQNAAGLGPLSSEVTTTPYGPLAAPPKPTVNSTGDQAVTVTWDAATVLGANPITYTVTAVGGPADLTSCVTITALSCVVTGLTTGSSYTFTVTATDSAGQIAASVASAAVTAGAPSNVSVLGDRGGGTDVEDDKIKLKWVKYKNQDPKGPAPTTYAVSMSPSGVCVIETKAIEDEEKCEATALSSNTEYTFTVTASNGNGTSVPTVVSFTTDP